MAYERFQDGPGLARVATLKEIRDKDGNLSIPLYIAPAASVEAPATIDQNLAQALAQWLVSSAAVRTSLKALFDDRPHPG